MNPKDTDFGTFIWIWEGRIKTDFAFFLVFTIILLDNKMLILMSTTFKKVKPLTVYIFRYSGHMKKSETKKNGHFVQTMTFWDIWDIYFLFRFPNFPPRERMKFNAHPLKLLGEMAAKIFASKKKFFFYVLWKRKDNIFSALKNMVFLRQVNVIKFWLK